MPTLDELAQYLEQGNLRWHIEQGNVLTVIGPELFADSPEQPTDGAPNQLLERAAHDPSTDLNALRGKLTAPLSRLPRYFRKLAHVKELKLFVTTNVDPTFARSLDEERYAGADRHTIILRHALDMTDFKAQDLPLSRIQSRSSIVYHLFGSAQGGSPFAVTEEDTLDYLLHLHEHKGELPKLLAAIKERPLLLLGCSFPKWFSRFFILLLRILRGGSLSKTSPEKIFVVDQQVRGDPELSQFLTHRKVKVLSNMNAWQFVDALLWRFQPSSEGKFVFLNYVREDSELVNGVRDQLLAAGIPTWMDVMDLQPGDPWSKVIKANIDKCECFVPIVSSRYFEHGSQFLRDEVARAMARAPLTADTLICPIVVEEADGSSPMNLPWEPDLRPLFDFQVHKTRRGHMPVLANDFVKYLQKRTTA